MDKLSIDNYLHNPFIKNAFGVKQYNLTYTDRQKKRYKI